MIVGKLLNNTQKLNQKTTFGLYNIIKHNPVSKNLIPVYESKDLSVDPKGQNIRKYLQLTPFFMEKIFGWQKKQFVVKMDLCAESKQLVLKCLNHDDIIEKQVSLDNLVPVTFEDFVHSTRRKLFMMPPFIDNEMVYYNEALDEYYVFDNQGTWEEAGVNHPSLSLSGNYDEKKWFDKIRII